MHPSRAATGRSGEQIATWYLQSLGYRILERNVRIHRDEIDIVAFDPADRVVVFAEVKARTLPGLDYHPALNLTWRKKRAMRRAARAWMARFGGYAGYRMDLLCIAEGRVADHLKELTWS